LLKGYSACWGFGRGEILFSPLLASKNRIFALPSE
jgi:hypothetical protein